VTTIRAINEAIAVRVTTGVATMWCAYIFAFIALLGLPQAIHDTVEGGGLLPMVTWTSQALLQLVLLSVIMVGQAKLNAASEARAAEDHASITEILSDLREDHATTHSILADLKDSHGDIHDILKRMQGTP
jgi:hypothetical protein